MKEVEIELFGPYSLIEDKEPSIFSVPLGKQQGIYLWTIPFENKYLTYYVGKTGKSFISRNLEHIRNYYSGKYTLYDPKEFAKGKKIRLWNGMWKKDAKETAWYPGDTYNISIGQGYLKATPIQVLTAISAIANGGKLVKPQIVKGIVDEILICPSLGFGNTFTFLLSVV